MYSFIYSFILFFIEAPNKYYAFTKDGCIIIGFSRVLTTFAVSLFDFIILIK